MTCPTCGDLVAEEERCDVCRLCFGCCEGHNDAGDPDADVDLGDLEAFGLG